MLRGKASRKAMQLGFSTLLDAVSNAKVVRSIICHARAASNSFKVLQQMDSLQSMRWLITIMPLFCRVTWISRLQLLYSVLESLVRIAFHGLRGHLLSSAAFHSVDSSELKPGDWLGVIGCGGLGQLATQYAKAMGCHVVGIDINDDILAQCKAQGADAVFNSMTNKGYVEELLKLTGGGVKAAAVFSNADAAYAGAPQIIKLGGVLMVVGLPHNPLKISSMDLALGKYQIKAESTSIPQRMGKAMEFTAKHNIHPEVDLRNSLDEVQNMVTAMKSGQNIKRMAVVF